jgi:hypothetical protein
MDAFYFKKPFWFMQDLCVAIPAIIMTSKKIANMIIPPPVSSDVYIVFHLLRQYTLDDNCR